MYNLGLATKMVEMNYTYCLIVYCSSSISSSIRIYPLSRPFVFSARELSRIRLPGFVIVFCVCRTMRIRMHTDESTENGNRGLQSRLPLCIYSQSKFHWRSLANNQLKIQEEKKAIGMIEGELGFTLHLCKKIRLGHTLFS